MLRAVSLHGAVPLRGVAVPSKQRLISNAVSLRGGITPILHHVVNVFALLTTP